MDNTIFIGVYNILAKLTEQEGKEWFTVEEICAIPEAEGYCTGADTHLCLNHMLGFGPDEHTYVSMKVEDGVTYYKKTHSNIECLSIMFGQDYKVLYKQT